MGLDNSLCNRQSKTRPQLRCRFGLPITVKYMVQMLRGYSRTRIGHNKPDFTVFTMSENPDRAALWRELDRVANEIRENLKYPLSV